MKHSEVRTKLIYTDSRTFPFCACSVFTKSFGELSFEKDGFFKALKGLAVSLYFVMLHQDLEQEEVERRFKEHHLALVAEAKSLQAGQVKLKLFWSGGAFAQTNHSPH